MLNEGDGLQIASFRSSVAAVRNRRTEYALAVEIAGAVADKSTGGGTYLVCPLGW